MSQCVSWNPVTWSAPELRASGFSELKKMFNSMLRDFEDDPFFSDPFHAHRDHVHRMMRSFSEPFGSSLMPSISDVRNRGQDVADPFTSSSLALRNDHRVRT
ncbi:hypothetical protein OJAV_G00129710 [Oryzias javanicus]|uniref:Myeloid leukemia factor 1 n=1 Tax=Oryzias javanicus TaxID=123683 RepID=A0A437CPT4_ORYJA|nr:hypothetical protein OJAV_G00129710 [Oryzias javanicus]